MVEERNVRVMVRKAGGTAGKHSLTYSIALPTKWIKSMGLSADERHVMIAFDGEQITIKKSYVELEQE